MKVLIVAKTRRGAGACVGGITQSGQSVRLVAGDAATNQRAGLEYEVGEVWEIQAEPDSDIVPPHVENVIVRRATRLRRSEKLVETILRFMPPVAGGPDRLFDGLAQYTAGGGLYVCDRTGLPARSTLFWLPDRPLELDFEGKRIRYRYPTADGGRTLTYVGFQEPLREIPAGTLLRVSLAHRWRPQDKPDEELRCFVQLSGWFLDRGGAQVGPNRPVHAGPRSKPAAAPEITLARARDVLKRTFGFSDFLPVQAEVISRVLRKEDTLVVMPTGGGKSLCYQLPALLFDGLTVVVSPLVALMQDQVRHLRQWNVPAAALNHTVGVEEYCGIANRARHGGLRILYVAPETLLRPETLLLLEQSRLACLAIDEGHCISEWGHDFRPEYRQLQSVRKRFPSSVCLVLTATATGRVRQDIRTLLRIPSAGEFVASFNRQNLFLAVEPRRDALAQLGGFLQQHPGESGIIYCGTREQADDLATTLTGKGHASLPYHAGLEPSVRHSNQEKFINDEVPLIVATVAFGMGINKPNVRFVVHAHLPKDIESYYQEIGRAGRDGLPAHCLLLYSRADAFLYRRFIEQGAVSERPGRQARLNALMRFTETLECRRVPLLSYFGEELSIPCGHCDNCAKKPPSGPTESITDSARKFLQCVRLSGQIFGPGHIIAVLRGSKSERVLSRRHDRLSVYGEGKEHSVEQWRRLVDEFITQRLIEQELEFGSLRLTPKGLRVLEGHEEVMRAIILSPTGRSALDQPESYSPELFEQLRALRRTLAAEAQLPLYCIFPDRSLIEMCARLPKNDGELMSIHGVGESKLEKYGARFLELIELYRQKNPTLPGAASGAPGAERIPGPVARRRSQEIGERFAAGENLDAIAESVGIMRETALQHLSRFVEGGGRLDPGRVLALCQLSDVDRSQVLAVFEQLGAERLSPVYRALGGRLAYEQLHLLRLYLLCKRS